MSHLVDVLRALQAPGSQLPLSQEHPRAGTKPTHPPEIYALDTVAGHLSQSLELQDVLTVALDEVVRLVDLDACFISLLNEETGELILCAERGFQFSYLGTCMPSRQGLFGQVVEAGQSTVTAALGYLSPITTPDFTREEAEVIGLIPMRTRRQVIGILGVMSRRARTFTDRELTLLQAIAGQVGIAAENAQLYQAVRRHAARLESAYQELQDIDQKKDEFIQNVSHELRTPLSFLKGYVELLIDETLGPLGDAQREGLDIMIRRTNQMIRLVESITTMEAVNPETLDLRPLDLGELAHSALQSSRLAMEQASITPQEEIPPKLPPALADGTRIIQVFDNLLANAIKFSPEGGTITVRVREMRNHLRVEVADTGIGIPPEKQTLIFNRFYQVDGGSQRQFGGIGLGLAIVKVIVEAHGGRVGVKSEVGVGSTFYFTVPKADA
jgi:signal transduction histidine kinase